VAGVSPPHLSEKTKERFDVWLQTKSAPGLSYLAKRSEEKKDPSLYFEEIKSILVFGLYYFPGWAEGDLKVSNYSWSSDYHVVLKEKLEATTLRLQEIFGTFKYRVSVDTAPLMEK